MKGGRVEGGEVWKSALLLLVIFSSVSEFYFGCRLSSLFDIDLSLSYMYLYFLLRTVV